MCMYVQCGYMYLPGMYYRLLCVYLSIVKVYRLCFSFPNFASQSQLHTFSSYVYGCMYRLRTKVQISYGGPQLPFKLNIFRSIISNSNISNIKISNLNISNFKISDLNITADCSAFRVLPQPSWIPHSPVATSLPARLPLPEKMEDPRKKASFSRERAHVSRSLPTSGRGLGQGHQFPYTSQWTWPEQYHTNLNIFNFNTFDFNYFQFEHFQFACHRPCGTMRLMVHCIASNSNSQISNTKISNSCILNSNISNSNSSII